MSLFSEIAVDVDDVLSDPDLNTADIRMRRRTGVIAGANVYDDPVETFEVLKFSGVSFTRETRRSDFEGSLVVERVDELTMSPWATIVEVNGVAANTRVYVTDIYSTNEFVVDGKVRQIHQIRRTPSAGPHVAVWQVLLHV